MVRPQVAKEKKPSSRYRDLCDSYRYIEQVAMDSRQLAILHGIYFEIPPNISLNTAGNNDLALTFLLVPADRLRQHHNLHRIIQYFLRDSERHWWIKLFLIFIVVYVVIRGIKKGKAIPLQAWGGPEGSMRVRLPDFKTIGT